MTAVPAWLNIGTVVRQLQFQSNKPLEPLSDDCSSSDQVETVVV